MLRPKRKSETAGQDHPTRLRLVEVVAGRIEEVGVDGVDIDDVLTKVGVTKGAMYHYFGSINDLLVAGLLHAYTLRMEQAKAGAVPLITECNTASEMRERMYSLVATYHQIPVRNPLRFLRLQAFTLAFTQPELAPEVARLQTELTDVFVEICRELQRRGWVRKELDPRAYAALIQALSQGRVVDDIVPESDRVDPEAWVALVKQILDATFFVGA